MHKLLPGLFLLSVACFPAFGQKVTGKLLFEQGKTITINMQVNSSIAQQAGNQAIDFATEGAAKHSYKVTNTTDNSTSLHHDLARLWFRFEGMGQKRSFDSDNPKDRQSQFGKQFDEICSKKYDVVIDTTGKTLMTIPQKIELTQQDERLVVIANMLRDLTSVIYPPQKGTASFFKVMPGYEVGIGDTWTDTTSTPGETSATSYTLSSITDSVFTVDFKTLAVSAIKSEIMGNIVTTNLTNTTTGKITLDKVTGIIREKTSTTSSSGTAEALGSSLPIHGKTTISIVVEQE
jgi:hypothetical protein